MYRSPKTDAERENSKEEMELEELETLISKKMADEDAASELQMISIVSQPAKEIDNSPEPSLAGRKETLLSASPQSPRAVSPHTDQLHDPIQIREEHENRFKGDAKQAQRDELYDPFQMEEEYENQVKQEVTGAHGADLQGHGSTLRDGSDFLCAEGKDTGLDAEEQLPRQAEEGFRLCKEETNDCNELHIGQDKSLAQHDQKREDQPPSLFQLEQDNAFTKIKIHLNSTGMNQYPWVVNQQTDRPDETVELCGSYPTSLSVFSPRLHSTNQRPSQASSSVTDMTNPLQSPYGVFI